MHYVSISFTHKNTDIGVREKLSFSDNNRRREILRLIGANDSIAESMALSTCNRVEIFAYVLDTQSSIRHILNSISILTLVPFEALELRADIYEDQGAIHHLFAVASSLDSLVVGETQIAGQLKEAFKFAYDNEDCGVNISSAMHFAFKCAAEVRALTTISKNPVSVSSVAVAKAKEIYGNIGGMSAVVIGAGEMSRLAAQHLINAEVNVIIINRDDIKAQTLAKELGELASYASFDKLSEYINRYRLIFSATGAPNAIITNEIIEQKDFHRYFFDIAVPRDIDIEEDEYIHVYAVDDLEEIVRTNLALREEQASIAYSIVGKSTTSFFKWRLSEGSTPAIKALRLKAKDIACKEIEKAVKKGYLKCSDQDEASKLVHQVFKAFLHTPSVRLKEKNSDDILKALEYLFDIKIQKDENLEGNLK
ncbi:glutamyl-tRNA reductase [Campylobacter fetus]|uniref:glutamyl-tRNA reductase n=1 Tax=Campylobacter fetus TaxID=196 RepID=UPI000509004B|nr:glutamyl-tRNA reductase [Campylobacter fetus]WKW17979.1 glutamyl-tRNA reductase [Campylobacter fetus subsp. fetus]AIR78611.1 glutamyl-tRNA reductase [Campylobacter fetus subsp. fetus 04/554]EAJ5693175.1 glutamyl-tRNA reductase [Campylobacter fetus]EAJ5704886.1 glutamyl-tRNA reductase [Campylobacter fetus]EAJ9256329.1 glutamyl-tRNA reductase [Campylobacter fetus]